MSEVTTLSLEDMGDTLWDAAHRDLPAPPPGWTQYLPAPPPGWTQYLVEAVERGGARIRSERLGRTNGVYAIQGWLRRHLQNSHGDHGLWVAGEVHFDFGRTP